MVTGTINLMIASCPAGNVSKSGSYIKQTDSIRVSFYKYQCEGCPYQSKCDPIIKERTASLLIPLKSRRRILESTELMDDEIRTFIGRIRNGVETIPSILRNKYMVDKMPVRGKLKIKQFFGFKAAYEDGLKEGASFRINKELLECKKKVGDKAGVFDVVAHPDRIFRRIKRWDSEASELAKQIKECAARTEVALEKNISNMFEKKRKHLYWHEFWLDVPDELKIIYGVDAHSVEEMEENYRRQQYLDI